MRNIRPCFMLVSYIAMIDMVKATKKPRAPRCDKDGLRKGPWLPEEDEKLVAYIREHGHGNWRSLPEKAGLRRCGKSCRLRWTNYLRPDVKRGGITLQEEYIIIQLHAILGNKWSAIASHIPGRTDNEIKNHWNTHLRKQLLQMGADPFSLMFIPDQERNFEFWERARIQTESRLATEHLNFLFRAGINLSNLTNNEQHCLFLEWLEKSSSSSQMASGSFSIGIDLLHNIPRDSQLFGETVDSANCITLTPTNSEPFSVSEPQLLQQTQPAEVDLLKLTSMESREYWSTILSIVSRSSSDEVSASKATFM